MRPGMQAQAGRQSLSASHRESAAPRPPPCASRHAAPPAAPLLCRPPPRRHPSAPLLRCAGAQRAPAAAAPRVRCPGCRTQLSARRRRGAAPRGGRVAPPRAIQGTTCKEGTRGEVEGRRRGGCAARRLCHRGRRLAHTRSVPCLHATLPHRSWFKPLLKLPSATPTLQCRGCKTEA